MQNGKMCPITPSSFLLPLLFPFSLPPWSPRKFMADASQAEFSRDGNPLYHPNHTPIKLPAHIMDGDLDIKIPEYSTNHLRDEGNTTLPTPSSQTQTEACPVPNSTGTGIRPHENGIREEPTLKSGDEAQGNGIRESSTVRGMEKPELSNVNIQASSVIETRTKQ